MNWSYFVWIPTTLLVNLLACWISVKYNQTEFVKTWLLLAFVGFIPTWAIASYFSRNLIFDGMLLNFVFVLSTPVIMAFLGQAANFSVVNWVGVVVALVGFIMLRWS